VAAATLEVPQTEPPERSGPFLGVVLPQRTVELPAESEGTLSEIFVRVGDRVEQGDVLARVDSRGARSELRMARADFAASAARRARAQALLRQARRQHARREALGSRAVAVEEIQRAGTEVEALRAEMRLAAAEVAARAARIRHRRDALDDVELRAPWPAVIAAIGVETGAWVSPGQPVVRLLGRGPARVRFAIPEGVRTRLSLGASISIRTVGASEALVARVETVAPEIDPATRMIIVEAVLDGSTDSALTPGSEVHVSL